ncbi:E3 ubiquitin-protein ligase MARCHF6 isoform X1 [Hydra vulgaris]|uniref:RING-type E3 ubiquitin transferase n=1 Tax=Hydra vulgaris TaxID=6087 RepID=T2MIF6_HYDVU|nr:E3 ubiquitin-protein ligase MARCHF6 [Hydra vulgaris]
MNDIYDDADFEDRSDVDCCRVCRAEGTNEKPLHYPCLCTGSIKYIHQDCLVLWLKHSKKEYCELCNHKFTFRPVYSPDMPKSIPLVELIQGLGKNILRALRYWLHYTLVVVAWLGIVPLTAYRVYKCLFAGSLHSLIVLPMDMLSLENILLDIVYGGVVVGITVSSFIMLLWLREQFTIHGGPDWLNDQDNVQAIQIDIFIRNLIARRLNNVNHQDERNPVVLENPGPLEHEEDHIALPHVNNIDHRQENIDNDHAEQNENEEINNANEDDGNAFEEGGWNPDAILEDLTWEKFLGIDGSFVFLEHVFWIISLNTTFVLVFAFCPYHVGQALLSWAKINGEITGTDFDGGVILLCGYLFIAISLILVYSALRYTSFKRVRKTIGLCYVILKVSLLMVLEIGLFPLICGWWLDICSLPLFAITLKDRKESFIYAPGTTTFLHWLAGMLYVFYFAAFVMLVREILRPGVLWFIRNINDPQFHPVKEMIRLSVLGHSRRFLLSLVVFGTTILVLVWIPVKVIKYTCKSLTPYNMSLSGDAPISEMSLELLLLQVILPAFLEQGHARKWLKVFIQFWVHVAASVLDLQSYLLGDVDLKDCPPERIIHVDNQGKWQRGPVPKGISPENALEGVGSPTVRAYARSPNFGIKLTILISCCIVSFVLASFCCFTIPVLVGRFVLSLFFDNTVIHELYTAAAGFYLIWLFLRALTTIYAYPAGYQGVLKKMKTLSLVIIKTFVTTIALFGFVPLLLGTFFELVVVIPLRVPLDQTPLLYLWQDWALGILHLKIICAIIMVGPDWWLKDAIDRVYRNGFMNINLSFILKNIIAPVCVTLLLAITAPYFAAKGVLPLLGFGPDFVTMCLRRMYPTLMLLVLFTGIIILQGKQFRSLYEKIKNEKYLIGKVLVNYERKPKLESPESVGIIKSEGI